MVQSFPSYDIQGLYIGNVLGGAFQNVEEHCNTVEEAVK